MAFPLLCACGTGFAADALPCGVTHNEVRLQVSVDSLHSAAGNVTITLYPDDPKRFLERKGKIAIQHVPALLPVTTACFAAPAPGDYAIVVYHDEDDDHHWNRTLLGLPDEGYGFSNNPRLFLGPPSYEAAHFSATWGDNPVAIRMRY